MNQNPDSRELKELATKTGLDKKVLQVCIYMRNDIGIVIISTYNTVHDIL